jgi:hypothetical protein
MASRHRLSALAFFLLLAVAHTWPLASAPGRLSRNDNADTVLNEWILAWDVHAATHDPRHFFDGNMFYPEPDTLAYSEPLLVPAALGAPLFWLGASAVLVYNLLVLAGLTLTGWAAFLLVARWTDDAAAGLLGGVIIAFNAHTLTRLPHLQALHVEFLPLALLAADALLLAAKGTDQSAVARARLAAGLLAVAVVLEGWTSYYALVLTVLALAVGWLVRTNEWWPSARRALPLVVLAATVAVLALLPVLLPYRALGHVRPLDEVAAYSAGWRDYLTTPARVHYGTWARRWFSSTGLFPGVTAITLSLVALARPATWRSGRARTALAFGLIGVALSFGPALPGYAFLYRWLLPLQGIRNAARFGYLGIVALAILAGFGLAQLRRGWQGSSWRTLATALVVLAANLDAWSAPIEYVPAAPVSAVNARLAGTTAVVAYFPLFQVDRVFHNAPYLIESTAHWRPMLNGYSGFIPPSYADHARAAAHFPAPDALAALRQAGVTHVFVHDRSLRDWTDNETADAVRTSPELQLLATDGDLTLYALVNRAGGS